MIGDNLKTVGTSKNVIQSISSKLVEPGSCEAKQPPGRPRKTAASEDWWIGNESKENRFATATAICKRANANLGIKISRDTNSWILNEINLNSRVASTNPYISKKNKMSRLKFPTEHVVWPEEQLDCVHFRNESTCSVVTGEDSFDTVLRNDICSNALKVV